MRPIGNNKQDYILKTKHITVTIVNKNDLNVPIKRQEISDCKMQIYSVSILKKTQIVQK